MYIRADISLAIIFFSQIVYLIFLVFKKTLLTEIQLHVVIKIAKLTHLFTNRLHENRFDRKLWKRKWDKGIKA